MTNDDGISRRGLAVLASVALECFERVTVVAPSSEMSGVSHGITLSKPLRLQDHGDARYSVTGTPADCVIAALGHVLKDSPPDIVLSGINHGPNLGNDVFYSGTVAGAREGVIKGIPALAFSLVGSDEAAFEAVKPIVRRVLKDVCRFGVPDQTLLNVNIPLPSADASYAWEGVKGIRGIRLTELGDRSYSDEIIFRDDPRGGSYFWIGGKFPEMKPIPGTDCQAIMEGYVSLTPLGLDATRREVLGSLDAFMDKESN